MAELFVNPNLISNINILSKLPLPLFKLIVDWVQGMILNTYAANMLTYSKLKKILFN